MYLYIKEQIYPSTFNNNYFTHFSRGLYCSSGHTQTKTGKFHGKWKMRVCLKKYFFSCLSEYMIKKYSTFSTAAPSKLLQQSQIHQDHLHRMATQRYCNQKLSSFHLSLSLSQEETKGSFNQGKQAFCEINKATQK